MHNQSDGVVSHTPYAATSKTTTENAAVNGAPRLSAPHAQPNDANPSHTKGEHENQAQCRITKSVEAYGPARTCNNKKDND